MYVDQFLSLTIRNNQLVLLTVYCAVYMYGNVYIMYANV